MQVLNKVVDGDFAERMVRNIQQGLDSEDYAGELASIYKQWVSLQKELMVIARVMCVRVLIVASIPRSIEGCRRN